MSTNDLNEKYKSAYRTNNGTGRVLIKTHNDMLRALDTKHRVSLTILDLSAVTIDQDVLL